MLTQNAIRRLSSFFTRDGGRAFAQQLGTFRPQGGGSAVRARGTSRGSWAFDHAGVPQSRCNLRCGFGDIIVEVISRAVHQASRC